MTLEEKAKAYDEALERASNLYKDAIDMGENIRAKQCEIIFPELSESEDERIRKGMLQGFKDYNEPEYEWWKGVKVKECIAWLEKQGQSKKTSIWKHWKDGIAGNGDGIPVFLIKNSSTYSLSSCLGFECDYIELSELDNLMLEQQGEQKPAWNEEDEKIYQSIIDDTVQENQLNGKQIDWLRNIKYRHFPQPKQKWSEEDKEMFDYALDMVEWYGGKNEEKSRDVSDWIKSLKQRLQ